MDFIDKQIAPPKDWSKFEDLCLALFKEVWNDPSAQKNGRRGRPQHGVDVFGSQDGDPRALWGVQCKVKHANYGAKPTRVELEAEIIKAERFRPTLAGWVLATTAPTDGVLQQAAREVSLERGNRGAFPVSVLGWEEIQARLATAPKVIAAFYPEHFNKLEMVDEELQALPSQDEWSRLTQLMEDIHGALVMGAKKPLVAGHWQRVEFDNGRDLGPALMGRRLGPGDAAACPGLDEADTLLSQLKMAFSARIIGEPGAGKSVCAYQAASTLAQAGHDVMRLTDPRSEPVLPQKPDQRTVYLVDDAHLIPSHVLSALEEGTSPNQLLVTVHNAVEGSDGGIGAVALNGSRAVKTIASALKADLAGTLEAVRRADDGVGEGMVDEDVAERIDEAARDASVPWQFCFVLGGGWRRSRQAAARANSAGADLVLAAVAARQLASRDARAGPAEIIEFCARVGIPEREAEKALGWLASERLVLGKADYRCPHQRFSEVVLNEILSIQEEDGRKCIGRIINSVLSDSKHPLAGIRLLLYGLRSREHDWRAVVDEATVRRIAERCWNVPTEGRLFGALVLSELWSLSQRWVEELIEPHAKRFAEWVSSPGEAAYGIGWLLNQLLHREKDLAKEIVTASDPVALGNAFSITTLETAYGTCSLMRSTGSAGSENWKGEVMNVLDKDRFIGLGEEWADGDGVYRYAELCESLLWWDEDVALEMAEGFVPTVRSLLASDPVRGFSALSHSLAMGVLRAFDPLGVFVGRNAPDGRRKAIARSICARLDPTMVACHLGQISKRDFQSAAELLSFLLDWAPRKFGGILADVEWSRLDTLIGREWGNLPHDAEALLGILSATPDGRQSVQTLVADNLERIERFPARLVPIAPHAAIEHLRRGRSIRLAWLDRVDWYFGGIAVTTIDEMEPNLVHDAFVPFTEQLSRALSAPNAGFYRDSERMIGLLLAKAPNVGGSVLSRLDVDVAERGLTDCLRGGRAHQRSAALIVQAAVDMPGKTGAMARRLRERFPKASVPPVPL